MNERQQTARKIFEKAVEITSSTERDEHIDLACGSDMQLAEEVWRLIKAHEAAGERLGATTARGKNDEDDFEVAGSNADGMQPTVDLPSRKTLGRSSLIGPLQASSTNWRRRHGDRLDGRAGKTGAPPRRNQTDS